MQLHIETWCKAKEPQDLERIVFLHGLGGIGALWRPIASMLEKDYFIIAPDQRAHGRSHANESDDFSPTQFGSDILETFQSSTIPPSWIVGHSMGVRTSCAFSEIAPEYVKGLVLIDLGFTGIGGGGIGETLQQFLNELPNEFSDRKEAKRIIEGKCPDPAIAQYLMAGITITQKNPDTPVRFPFQKDLILKTLEDAGVSTVKQQVERFAQTGKPVLALRGEKSTVWTREDFEKDKLSLEKFSNVSFVEVANCGHGLPFERRKEFVSILLDFIHSHLS